MKLSTHLATSIALASTAQACVRILVNEVWQEPGKATRDITLWDQDMVSAYHVPYGESHGSTDVWRGNGYTVELNQANDWSQIGLPNGQVGTLSRQAREQGTTSDGKTQVYYCLWDNYDCSNYVCGLP